MLHFSNEALQLSQQAINDLQQRRSRFMQTAAHQLKSPLAGIQTLTGLIRDDIVPEDEVRLTCEKIIQRCRDGIVHIHELLTLARVQGADPRRHDATPTHIGDVVQDLCRKNLPLAEAKGLTLECRVPEDADLYAHIDSADLKDCVANLLENAIQYTNGPGEVTVTVGTETLEPSEVAKPAAAADDSPAQATQYISVTVTDTGMGIEPEMLSGKDGAAGSVYRAARPARLPSSA